MEVDPAQSLNALIERARAAMAGDLSAAPTEPPVGEAADGRVRAELSADGRLRTLTVDPKLLRDGLEQVCAHVITAVNAALGARPGAADTGPLLAELKAVQEQSVVEMSKISQAFTAALAQALNNKNGRG